jgi:methylmalonyl-CoA/ethylmalonyl-CoA epimerase
VPSAGAVLRQDLHRRDTPSERQEAGGIALDLVGRGFGLRQGEVRDHLVEGAAIRRLLGKPTCDRRREPGVRAGWIGREVDRPGKSADLGEFDLEGSLVPRDVHERATDGRPQLCDRKEGVEQSHVGGYAEGGGRIVQPPDLVEPTRQIDANDDRADWVYRDHVRQGTLRPMAPSARQSSVPATVRRLGKVHLVALIVRSIEDALGLWRDTLGLELETIMDIESDKVRIAFLAIGESKVELVEPTDESTGVARFLATKGEGFHHICFEVANLAETLLKLEIGGLELIDTSPRRGAEGPVAFIHPRACHGVLVELIEAPGGPAWTALGFAAR